MTKADIVNEITKKPVLIRQQFLQQLKHLWKLLKTHCLTMRMYTFAGLVAS